MACSREFDHDEGLEKAMQAFCAKGYECAFVQDLADGVGINRGSLYATFRDKRSLNLAALDRYCRQDQTNRMLVSASGSRSN